MVRFRLLVSAIVLLQSLLIYVFVAQRFPLSGDDYSYLYQARLFAAGKLYAQDQLYDHRHPLNHCITVSCLRDQNGRRFSQYAPGWPAVLSMGVLLKAPWLVQPILAALLTFLLLGYVEERMGPGLVKVGAFLLTACLFYAYYGASYRPHVATALCIFGAFLAYERARHKRQYRASWIAIAAILLGVSALMRYIDWVPLGLWIAFNLARSKRHRALVIFALCLGILASGNLAWGWTLSGHPLIAPTHLGAGRVEDQLRVSWDGLTVTLARLALLCWVFPPVLLLPRYWTRARAAGLDQTPLMLFLCNAGVYFLFSASVGGFGPRYLFAYFPFLVIVVVEIYARFIRDGTVVDRRWWNIVVAAQLAGSAMFVTLETYMAYWRRDVERTMVQRSNEGAARRIVLLTTGTRLLTVPGGWTYWFEVTDLTTNPPDLTSADTLYLANCDPRETEMLEERFAGRQLFVYTFPGHLVRGGGAVR